MYLTLSVVSLLLLLGTSRSYASSKGNHEELLVSLDKKLLSFLEDEETLPNPSVHLALRLSTHHNLAMESNHLTKLTTKLHDDIENSLAKAQPVVGRLALYVLALKASCYDVNSLTLRVNQNSETLLTHLKRQLEHEKEHIAFSHRPLTTYYQYSLGVLALCVSGVRVNSHVSNKLIKAVVNDDTRGHSLDLDSFAMAGMALQCLTNSPSEGLNEAQLDKALDGIKQKLLDSRRSDGHIGNEFSTGLAVQTLLAMGSHAQDYSLSMSALRDEARKGTYHSPMAISQALPALHKRSYLSVQGKHCRNDDDTITVEAESPKEAQKSDVLVLLEVEVVKLAGEASLYSVEVPAGSSLLEALSLLQREQQAFTFETEGSLWGPFLSRVNGEQARQSDRSYWNLLSDNTALSQGIKDYNVESAQKISIKNIRY